MKEEESKVTRFDYDSAPGYFAMHSTWWEQGAFKERIHNILSFLSSSGPRVLDVGTGVGTFAIELAEQGCQVIALDYSAQALGFCRANARKRKVLHSVQATRGGAEWLPFADETFDTVVAADILEHLYDPLALLREIRRVLRPGGKAVFETPNAGFLRIRGYRRLKSWLQHLVSLPESVNLADWIESPPILWPCRACGGSFEA
jgi:2-polyprenyl-3-methyl-5-hydroxy-6-metoxy-1,4-benzoquinol methylase